MRVLYLDDSGKVHANDSTEFFVFGGFSLDEGRWHQTVRQIAGAKSAFFANKGKPTDWEAKSVDFFSTNAWKRGNKRNFCHELVNILRRNGCRSHVGFLEKANAHQPLEESRLVPLLFQKILAKFEAEIVGEANTGSIVCDWSTYQMDHHVSNCVNSLVATNHLQLIRGGVTYGSSASLLPLQVADLISGAFRRFYSGQGHLVDFVRAVETLRFNPVGRTDFQGYPVDSIFRLF